MNMPLDFALYIVATIVVTGVVCIFVLAGIGLLLRKARMRRLAKAGVQYIGEDESMSMEQIAAAMDHAEGEPVEVYHYTPDEWEAMVQRAFDELHTTYADLKAMSVRHDFDTPEHRKLWLAIGGTAYEEIRITRPDGDEVTP